MDVWISAGRGIRYREHPTRRHGRKPDRYWCLKYKLDGRDKTEAVGWWSAGASQAQCAKIMATLRRNWRLGTGPRTWKELRAAEQSKPAAAEQANQDSGLTLAEFWEQKYRPRSQMTCRPSSLSCDLSAIRTWLAPLADRPLAGITTRDLEKMLVEPMLAAGKSSGYVERTLGIFSAIWSYAASLDIVHGSNPKSKAQHPKVDNQRERFLSQAEAIRLLQDLKERSLVTHDLALLSLFCGLRLNEGLGLTWADIDLEGGTIFIKDPKNKYNRHAYITAEIRAMLTGRYQGQPKTAKVLTGPKGGNSKELVSPLFQQAVKDLGFNAGVTDRRQKVVFHTLRHTFASWLVQMGRPLYTVSKLLGHRNIRWTERYAHLDPEVQREATLGLEGILTGLTK